MAFHLIQNLFREGAGIFWDCACIKKYTPVLVGLDQRNTSLKKISLKEEQRCNIQSDHFLSFSVHSSHCPITRSENPSVFSGPFCPTQSRPGAADHNSKLSLGQRVSDVHATLRTGASQRPQPSSGGSGSCSGSSSTEGINQVLFPTALLAVSVRSGTSCWS